MSSDDDTERPQAVLAVADRYLRRERPLSALVPLFAVAGFLGTYLVTTLLPAVAVAAALIVAARAPLVRSGTSLRLHTDRDPAAVVDAFAGPTPPVFALQWGVADELSVEPEGATYHVSYLFGLRSAELTVRNRTDTTPEGDPLVESELLMNGQSWATATTEIRAADDQTAVDVEYTSDRRFGLRRLPQLLVAKRYRDEALATQGYTVVERDGRLGR